MTDLQEQEEERERENIKPATIPRLEKEIASFIRKLDQAEDDRSPINLTVAFCRGFALAMKDLRNLLPDVELKRHSITKSWVRALSRIVDSGDND